MSSRKSSAPKAQIRAFPVFFGKSGLEDKRFLDWLLIQHLDALGVTFEPLEESNEIWFFDFDLNALKVVFNRRARERRKVLFVLEPCAVNPLIHSKLIQGLFDLVVTFDAINHIFEQFPKSEKVNVPYRGHLSNPDGSKLWISDRKTNSIAIAAGDKQSLVSSSRYWLRRDFVLAAVDAHIPVNLAGPGWSANSWTRIKQIMQSAFAQLIVGKSPNFKLSRPRRIEKKSSAGNLNLVGWVANESSFYSQNKVVVVIENDQNFHSEKLYAALATDSYVIYVGPTIPELSDLENVALSEPNVESLLHAARFALSQLGEPGPMQKRWDFLKRNNLDQFYREWALAAAFSVRKGSGN